LLGDAPAALAGDLALLQLRDLRDCLRNVEPRGSPEALAALDPGPPAEAPAPAPAAPATPPSPPAPPLGGLKSPPWARVAA